MKKTIFAVLAATTMISGAAMASDTRTQSFNWNDVWTVAYDAGYCGTNAHDQNGNHVCSLGWLLKNGSWSKNGAEGAIEAKEVRAAWTEYNQAKEEYEQAMAEYTATVVVAAPAVDIVAPVAPAPAAPEMEVEAPATPAAPAPVAPAPAAPAAPVAPAPAAPTAPAAPVAPTAPTTPAPAAPTASEGEMTTEMPMEEASDGFNRGNLVRCTEGCGS